MVVASLFLAIVPGAVAFASLAASLLLQWAGAALAMSALRGRAPWRMVSLEPLRAYVTFACWLAACVDRTVRWRGNSIRLGKDSAIVV